MTAHQERLHEVAASFAVAYSHGGLLRGDGRVIDNRHGPHALACDNISNRLDLTGKLKYQLPRRGLGAAIRYDGVKDGTALTVNQPFLVDLDPLESLLVQVSGKEIDDSSANDGLPTAKLKITPATNWSEGQSFTFSAPSHDDFAYDVTCDIRCATTSTTGGVHDILPRQDGWRRARLDRKW